MEHSVFIVISVVVLIIFILIAVIVVRHCRQKARAAQSPGMTRVLRLATHEKDRVAVISTGLMDGWSVSGGNTLAEIYAKELIQRDVIAFPERVLVRYISNQDPDRAAFEEAFKQLFYAEKVRFFCGALTVDDLESIIRALPNTTEYCILSTAYTSDKVLSDNVIRYSVADAQSGTQKRILMAQQFPGTRPAILYDPNSSWAESEARAYQPISQMIRQVPTLTEMSEMLIQTGQEVGRGVPIILLIPAPNVLQDLPPMPDNPIVLGNLYAFYNLRTIDNPAALRQTQIYSLIADPDFLYYNGLSRNIFGRLVSPIITNIVSVLLYACGVLAEWDELYHHPRPAPVRQFARETDGIYELSYTGDVPHTPQSDNGAKHPRGKGKGQGQDDTRELSPTEEILRVYGPGGIGELTTAGDRVDYSALCVYYDNHKRDWDVLTKYDNQGERLEFLSTETNIQGALKLIAKACKGQPKPSAAPTRPNPSRPTSQRVPSPTASPSRIQTHVPSLLGS